MTSALSPAHEEAAIRKLDAETEELLLQQELRRAEIRKTIAEAQEQEHDAAIRGIAHKERERVEELAAIQDHYVFHHLLEGPISQVTVFPLLNVMAAWDRVHPECPMNIAINSPGGNVTGGMHLFDQLTSYSIRGGGSHLVTMTVRGYAASMGAILVQAADLRVMGPESYLLVHELSAGTSGKIGDLKDDMKWYEKICDRIAHIFVERSGGKIAAEVFRENWERKDWWLSSDEALELGFVDRIG